MREKKKTFIYNTYEKSHGFIEKTLPVTFREFVIKNYTEDDLKASSIFQDILSVGTNAGLFSRLNVDEDTRIFIAEAQVLGDAFVSESTPETKSRILGCAVVEECGDYIMGSNNTIFDIVKENNLSYLVVDEEFRGLKLGKELLEYTITSLENKERPFLTLYVSDKNLIAQSLYKKLGFKKSELNSKENYEMLNIIDRNMKILSDIASKGIEMVYMNASETDLKDFFLLITKHDKFLGANSVEIENLKTEYPSGINIVKDWVLGFEKFRRSNKGNSFYDYLKLINPTEASRRGVIKSTKIMKKPTMSLEYENNIFHSMSIGVKMDMIAGKYGEECEMESTGKSGETSFDIFFKC